MDITEPVVSDPVVEVIVSEVSDPVVVVRAKNDINMEKHITLTLYDFEVKSIRIDPHTSASIDIVINTSDKQLYRTVILSGDNYANYGNDDDYVYYYIRDNIESIYNN